MANQKIIKQKEKEVNELADKLKKAKMVLLTDYRGINVADVTKLRADLRPTAVEYKVIKNNIIRRALEDNDFYKIKGGIIDGKVMTAEEIITLAKLPSRQELLGMLAGALLGNISKLAVGLNEVCKQKENA